MGSGTAMDCVKIDFAQCRSHPRPWAVSAIFVLVCAAAPAQRPTLPCAPAPFRLLRFAPPMGRAHRALLMAGSGDFVSLPCFGARASVRQWALLAPDLTIAPLPDHLTRSASRAIGRIRHLCPTATLPLLTSACATILEPFAPD